MTVLSSRESPPDDNITIPDAVRQMLAIVARLCRAYPKKKFTLDGRLVGDIGEVLVEAAYDLELFVDVRKHHDGQCRDGRLVQIKATMRRNLTFPADHVPDYYLGIHIALDGTFTEIFNGPGRIAREAVVGRKLPKTNLHSLSLGSLRALQTGPSGGPYPASAQSAREAEQRTKYSTAAREPNAPPMQLMPADARCGGSRPRLARQRCSTRLALRTHYELTRTREPENPRADENPRTEDWPRNGPIRKRPITNRFVTGRNRLVAGERFELSTFGL